MATSRGQRPRITIQRTCALEGRWKPEDFRRPSGADSVLGKPGALPPASGHRPSGPLRAFGPEHRRNSKRRAGTVRCTGSKRRVDSSTLHKCP